MVRALRYGLMMMEEFPLGSEFSLRFRRVTLWIQLLYFWTLYSILFLFKTHVSETGFCLHLQVEPSQLRSIDRASPYPQTAAPTLDGMYKPYARVKANIKIIKKLHTHTRPSTYVHALFHSYCQNQYSQNRSHH
jgi:hypothetical protein